MSTTKHILSIPLLLTIALSSACATHQPKPPENTAQGSADLSDSSVDICYVLGHTHRRFRIQAKDTAYVAQSYFDHQILKESTTDQKHYADFLNKATTFTATPHRVPAEQTLANSGVLAEDDQCRAPFTVTIRVGTTTKVTKGCRVSDDGALSHLVRDGEFLLFSRK